MADVTGVLDLRRSPLADTAFGVTSPGLSLDELPFRSLVEVRSPEPPTAPGLVWRLGPAWWLVDDSPTTEPALEVPLADEVRAANPGCPVVDVSAQRTTIVVTGEHATRLLAHGCAIDLTVLPVGEAVQGDLAGAQVVIGRTADELRIYVRPAFARHLAAWLTDAALPYT
ncbi:sarcosine oxidase subunit gamma family protein [Nocardioides sp.]|uniref:sarcosine oxidase subunit gamma family protein n=1 Tax=Nocardioides sp. TaxID=35761 RepID=UPI00271CBD59|nr:sarcosine oxidase subunit gamma family protein [Nocardioides sp.]MDO9457582.1 sarcosine oxidase subunit gamma family protein [Nocardioides sp.]